MKALPTQQRALAKRDALINAAAHCFATQGYERCTAKLMAAHAQVATGTFYQYFDNKDDMLHTLAQQRFEALSAALDNGRASSDTPSLNERLMRSLAFIYDFHAEQPELHQILEHRRHVDPKLGDILDRGEARLQEHVTRFVQSLNLPQPEVVAFTLFAMAEGVVHRHVFNGSGAPGKTAVIEQAAAMLSRYLTHAQRNNNNAPYAD